MKNKGIAASLLILLTLSTTLAAASATPQSEPKVDLNTATKEQLQSLPGVGPSIAGRIVEFREKNGPFKRIEDLMNVRGIGEKTFERLKDRLSVGKAAEKPSGSGGS